MHVKKAHFASLVFCVQGAVKMPEK